MSKSGSYLFINKWSGETFFFILLGAKICFFVLRKKESVKKVEDLSMSLTD